MGMIFNGILKIPMQFFILFIGVMVFIFYQFNPSPLNFNPQAEITISSSEKANEYSKLEKSLDNVYFMKSKATNDFLDNKNKAKSLLPDLKTFVAPILPEPIFLISLPENLLVNIRPNGIDPTR